MICKTPSPDQRTLALREGASHSHGPRATERYVARGEDLNLALRRMAFAFLLDGLRFEVTHIVHPASSHDCARRRRVHNSANSRSSSASRAGPTWRRMLAA